MSPKFSRPFKPPFDPSITQKVKNALYEAGREDLVEALRESGMAELETTVHKLTQRVISLEQEKVNFVTESGVYRAIGKKVGAAAIDWGKWAIRGTVATAALALASWIGRLAWKGMQIH